MQYRDLVLVSSLILFIGLGIIPLKWPLSRHHTFSQHVARRKASIVYYIVLFSIVLPPLVLFFTHFFTARIQASSWLNAFVIMSAVLQYGCTLVPEIGGIKSAVHRTLAGISGFLLLPILVVITLGNVSISARFLCFTALVIMLACVGITIRAKGSPKNFLLLQSIYFASFFTPLIAISYF